MNFENISIKSKNIYPNFEILIDDDENKIVVRTFNNKEITLITSTFHKPILIEKKYNFHTNIDKIEVLEDLFKIGINQRDRYIFAYAIELISVELTKEYEKQKEIFKTYKREFLKDESLQSIILKEKNDYQRDALFEKFNPYKSDTMIYNFLIEQ